MPTMPQSVTPTPKLSVAARPTDYATLLADHYSRTAAATRRRELAQFFTPPPVARYMAELVQPTATSLRLLDPAAGTGVLAAATCERLAGLVNHLHLDAYELDPQLADCCEQVLAHTQAWLAQRGTQLTYRVYTADFILSRAASLNPDLFAAAQPDYDAVILNPPYFKLNKADPRAVACRTVVHGQPNIYALFLAVSTSLLTAGGQLVAITPRSFATGNYFQSFRRYFFTSLTPTHVHLFNSRREAFHRDAVLQENVIMRAERKPSLRATSLTISTSAGVDDLHLSQQRSVPLVAVVDQADPQLIFKLPQAGVDEHVTALVGGWRHNLASLGLAVSTGPVVPFRTTELLHHDGADDRVPLLWLEHVRAMQVCWPTTSRHPQYISTQATRLLVPNRTGVLLRRFSAKEEARRLVAAPYLRGQLPGSHLGLENHLNYVYAVEGEMQPEQVVGLAALLSSSLLDRYIRIQNGHTQVNASELRALPLPGWTQLAALGKLVLVQQAGLEQLDDLVATVLGVPDEQAG